MSGSTLMTFSLSQRFPSRYKSKTASEESKQCTESKKQQDLPVLMFALIQACYDQLASIAT
jgi:hypothetical protein